MLATVRFAPPQGPSGRSRSRDLLEASVGGPRATRSDSTIRDGRSLRVAKVRCAPIHDHGCPDSRSAVLGCVVERHIKHTESRAVLHIVAVQEDPGTYQSRWPVKEGDLLSFENDSASDEVHTYLTYRGQKLRDPGPLAVLPPSTALFDPAGEGPTQASVRCHLGRPGERAGWGPVCTIGKQALG